MSGTIVRMKVIGIAGTNGGGKDTVGKLLAERHGFLFISVSDLLREECRARGLEVARENLRMISAEWRREYGLGVLVDRAIAKAESFGDRYVGVAAVPMRNVGEAQHVKDLGGTLVWVDADQRMRYERIQAANRGRAGEDDKTFEEFQAEELAEMYPPAGHENDPAVLNMAGVKAICDVTIMNEGSADKLESLVADLLSETRS